MSFYLGSTCFLAGLVLLFWVPRKPKVAMPAVCALWTAAAIIGRL